MAGTPLESSGTPPGAVSTEPSRSHGDPMEDTHLQATRKRPRLDSGCAARESMAADDASADQAAAAPAAADQKAPAARRAASRVTINMKSPGPARAAAGSPEQSAAAPPADASGVGAQSSAAISASSSPAQSPEIEVAEVEDMDQDPSTSSWRPLGEALRGQAAAEVVQLHEQLSLTDSFPKLRGNLDLRESLEEISNMIEKGMYDGWHSDECDS